MLADYFERITRVLEVNVDADAITVEVSPYPDRRDLRFKLPDLRIGMLDFLTLRQCELHTLVAERNSSLGRIMPDSQRLVYEHRFAAAARDCLTRLDPDTDRDIIAELRDAARVKAAALPQAVWNAVLGGAEFAHHLSLAGAPLPIQEKLSPDIVTPLVTLDRLLAAETLDGQGLEQALQGLQSNRGGGALLRSAALLVRYLEGAARALETRQAEQPLCRQGHATPRARTLNTVFLKFYAGRVQPYLSRIHRQREQWLLAITRLRARTAVDAPMPFAAYARQYLSPTAGFWRRFDQTVARHTRAWQTVLEQCKLLPKGPPMRGA